MVFHDYGVSQENTNIISFKRAAIYHPPCALPSSIRLTNDNNILHSKHLSFMIIILLKGIKRKDSMLWFEF